MDIEIGKVNPIEIEIGNTSDFEIDNDVKMYRGPKGDKGEPGPQGPKGEPGNPNAYMQYIDLSTNIEQPTELLDYMNKSGVYVAKNKGVLGVDGRAFTILAEGQFFEVQNYKDLAELVPDEEIPDEDNTITVSIPSIEGYQYYLKFVNGEFVDSVNITSENINDYVDIDTSNLITKWQLNDAYGIGFINGMLAVSPASQTDIDRGQAIYKPITPQRIEYAVKTKGSKYFPTKDDLKAVQDNVDTLVTDIEAILETMVTV